MIDSTLAKLSPITETVMNWRKATHLPRITWASEVKPAAVHKGVSLSKQVSATLKAGIDFANLSSVKSAIANGERGEVESLPWGEWEIFPFTILHKGNRYVRLYPSKAENQKPSTKFFADGAEVSREIFASYLTPSDAAKLFSGASPDCFNVKESNLIGIGEVEA